MGLVGSLQDFCGRKVKRTDCYKRSVGQSIESISKKVKKMFSFTKRVSCIDWFNLNQITKKETFFL